MQFANGEGLHGDQSHLDVLLNSLMQSSSPQLADPPAVLVDLPEDKQLVVVERVETRGPSVGVLCYFLDEPLLLLGRNGSQVEILRELLIARQ